MVGDQYGSNSHTLAHTVTHKHRYLGTVIIIYGEMASLKAVFLSEMISGCPESPAVKASLVR